MASVETTTVRVRRSTHELLKEAAERQGKSVTQLLADTVDSLEEERRLLLSAERAWAKMAAMPAEELALDGSLSDEEIARLQLDET